MKAACEVCGRMISTENQRFIEHMYLGKICYGSFAPIMTKKFNPILSFFTSNDPLNIILD